ncbi:hypothetical protein [Brevundimonas sp.]|uniref:hypothetical protein n=1 Tax=Brevundimonas sp. TaxID=1871086 RepID=UPI002ABA3F3C|nr:hypothetical protein [Brevundimonas sp.]MDZ4364016.1 hypothetical protein [Brevundimonas sp.]
MMIAALSALALLATPMPHQDPVDLDQAVVCAAVASSEVERLNGYAANRPLTSQEQAHQVDMQAILDAGLAVLNAWRATSSPADVEALRQRVEPRTIALDTGPMADWNAEINRCGTLFGLGNPR